MSDQHFIHNFDNKLNHFKNESEWWDSLRVLFTSFRHSKESNERQTGRPMSRLFFDVPLIFSFPSCSLLNVLIIIPLSFFKKFRRERERERERERRKRQQPWDLFSLLRLLLFLHLLFHRSVPCSLRRNQKKKKKKRRRKKKKKPGLRCSNDTLMTAAAASLFSPFQCSPNSIFQTSRMQHLFSIESKFDVLRNDSISFTEKSIWKKNQFEILSNLKIQFSFDILLAFKKQIGKNRKIQYSESINQLPLQIHNSIFLAEIGKDSFNTNPFWKYENIYEILKKVDLTFHWTSQLFTSNSNLNSSQKFSDLFWIFTLLRVLWHWILCFFGDSFRHLCLIFSDSFDICHSFWMIFFWLIFFLR